MNGASLAAGRSCPTVLLAGEFACSQRGCIRVAGGDVHPARAVRVQASPGAGLARRPGAARVLSCWGGPDGPHGLYVEHGPPAEHAAGAGPGRLPPVALRASGPAPTSPPGPPDQRQRVLSRCHPPGEGKRPTRVIRSIRLPSPSRRRQRNQTRRDPRKRIPRAFTFDTGALSCLGAAGSVGNWLRWRRPSGPPSVAAPSSGGVRQQRGLSRAPCPGCYDPTRAGRPWGKQWRYVHCLCQEAGAPVHCRDVPWQCSAPQVGAGAVRLRGHAAETKARIQMCVPGSRGGGGYASKSTRHGLAELLWGSIERATRGGSMFGEAAVAGRLGLGGVAVPNGRCRSAAARA